MKAISRFLKTYILPTFVWLFYYLWTRTWRLKIYEAPEFVEALHNGRIIFAHWHGDELVMVMVGPRYHCAAMTSTSDDGEIMTRVLKLFGYGISRGSSTRGGARALIGMVHLMKDGFNATVAVDGPKGPRFKVKPGVWALAKHSGGPIATIGVAKKSALVFNKSWNKTYLPWPFTKVVVSFGKPLVYDEKESEVQMCERLENALHEEARFAESKLLALGLALISTFLFSACSTSSLPDAEPGSLQAFMQTPARTPLKPVAPVVTGNEPPVVTYVMPNSRAAKYGFKVGDRILKLNGREVKSFVEFEKKIRGLPPHVQFEIWSRNSVHTKEVVLAEEYNRFGATTEPQNKPYVKQAMPTIANLSKGPATTVASASVDADRKNLFLNFVVDSKEKSKAQQGWIALYDKKTGKLIKKTVERIDALGTSPILIAKKFPLDFSLSDGLYARLSLGKQQFTFEFQE